MPPGGAGLALFYLYYLLRRKQLRTLLFSALLAIGGLAITCSIFVFIALGGGYLSEMMQAIFAGGFGYATSSREGSELLAQWINRIFILLVLVGAIFAYRFERKKVGASEGDGRDYLPDYFGINMAFACLIYFLIARFTNYYHGAICFLILYLFYLFSFIPFKRNLGIKLSSSIYGFLSLGAMVVFLCMYYGFGAYGFSYANSQAIKEDVSLIPEEERKKEGNLLAIDIDSGIYLVAEATIDFPYYANQTWWSGKVIDSIGLTIAYLQSEDRPTYLLVSTSEATWNNFGETIDAYYDIYMPEQVKNSSFSIYRAI